VLDQISEDKCDGQGKWHHSDHSRPEDEDAPRWDGRFPTAAAPAASVKPRIPNAHPIVAATTAVHDEQPHSRPPHEERHFSCDDDPTGLGDQRRPEVAEIDIRCQFPDCGHRRGAESGCQGHNSGNESRKADSGRCCLWHIWVHIELALSLAPGATAHNYRTHSYLSGLSRRVYTDVREQYLMCCTLTVGRNTALTTPPPQQGIPVLATDETKKWTVSSPPIQCTLCYVQELHCCSMLFSS